MDYKKYKLSLAEKIKVGLLGLLASAFAAWILYRSLMGMFLAFFLIPYFVHKTKRTLCGKRKEALVLQFKDAMQSVATSLMAGYSMENAWKESEKEMMHLYGKNADITQELKQMNTAVEMNQPLEKELFLFAKRSDCEDILSFAEIFLFAKRSGGNFEKLIQTAVSRISDKIEVEREIQTVIAGKKLESGIMNLVPALILAYLNVTSKEFLAPLYGNAMGVCVMSLAFVIYIGTMKLAEKIIDIRI